MIITYNKYNFIVNYSSVFISFIVLIKKPVFPINKISSKQIKEKLMVSADGFQSFV